MALATPQEFMESPFPVPYPATFSLDRQSIQVPNPHASRGESAIYINAAWPNLPNIDSSPVFPKTAHEIFELGLRVSRNKPCFGRREWDHATGDWAKSYTWETYEQVAERRKHVASGLIELAKSGKVDGGDNWSVGVWCTNRPEWQWVSMACASNSLKLVSLYDTLGPDVVEYCINHAETQVVFASSVHLPALLRLHKQCPGMRVLVSVDRWDDIEARKTQPSPKTRDLLKKWASDLGILMLDIDEVQEMGKAANHPFNPPTADTIGAICYTSGTTGMPKGAILTHRLLASSALSSLHGAAMKNEDSILYSFLPLSHIYERFCEDVALALGAPIGFSCGDNLRILEDIQILQPNTLCLVPRVLNRFYTAIKSATLDLPGVKGALIRKAYAAKLHNLRTNGTYTHAVYDRILFKKVRALLGGKVETIGSGSAPIAPEVLEFLKIMFSCSVVEGYGLTETGGNSVRCVKEDHLPDGTCGPPGAGVEVKLVDVPDMGYLTSNNPPAGEFCQRGGMVIPGYYKDEKKTKEVIDEDGWFHSGDIVTVDEKGRFKIVDRKKDLLKLSQGEYVSCEKIANVYSLCPLIAQIYVHGDSLENHVVGIVVPDPVHFAPLVSKVLGQSIDAADLKALQDVANKPQVVEALGRELAPFAQKARLLGYEQLKNNIYVRLEPFTVETGELTATQKLKRNVVADKFKKELKELYAKAPKEKSRM